MVVLVDVLVGLEEVRAKVRDRLMKERRAGSVKYILSVFVLVCGGRFGARQKVV